MELHNTYWLLRHGKSLANELGIIENGVKSEYGLSDEGRRQAAAVGQLLRAELGDTGCDKLHIYSSPFSRTQQTATVVAEVLGGEVAGPSYQVLEELRERFFGACLELSSHDNYKRVWAADDQDEHSHFEPDGESIAEVSARLTVVLQRLERMHRGCQLLLVAHGDTLSILAATMLGVSLRQHRQHGLPTAGFMRLPPLKA